MTIRELIGSLSRQASLAGWLCAVVVTAGGAQAPASTSIWQHVTYAPVTTPGAAGKQLMIIVGSGGHTNKPHEEPTHLRIDVMWIQPDDASRSETIANAKDIVVRLHTADGKILAAAPGDELSGACARTASGAGMWCSLIDMFPWSNNAQAWFEVRVPGQTWWLELPYGFARNPEHPGVTDRFPSEPHFFPPETLPLGAHDVVLPWLRVEY